MFENAFPGRSLAGKVFRRGQRCQGIQRKVTIGGVLGEGEQIEQPAGGNGGGGTIHQNRAAGVIVIVGRDAIGGGVLEVETGAGFGGLQIVRFAGHLIGRPKAIQRPGQPPRPGRIAAPALMGGLAQKLAGLQVENAFMGGGAIAAHQITAGGAAMGMRFTQQVVIPCLPGGVKDNPHVHHDVNKERFVRHEGAQVLPLFLEAQPHRLSGGDDHLFERVISRLVIPAFVSGPEQEAQVMHIAVGFAMLEQARVMFGFDAPRGAARAGVENPHHAAQEAFAPVGPGLAAVLPTPVEGVHREVVGIVFGQRGNLLLGKVEGAAQGGKDVHVYLFSKKARIPSSKICSLSGAKGAGWLHQTLPSSTS